MKPATAYVARGFNNGGVHGPRVRMIWLRVVEKGANNIGLALLCSPKKSVVNGEPIKWHPNFLQEKFDNVQLSVTRGNA